MEIKADIAATLKLAAKIVSCAEDRALDLINAKDGKTKWKVDYSTIEENGVNVIFIEDTRHDCPDHQSVYVSLADMSATDELWNTHLQGIRQRRERREAEKKLAQEEQERKSKEEVFERLKRELNK